MAGVYRPRHPERTVLYRVLFHYFDRFLAEYEDRFEKEYGFLRPVIKEVVEKIAGWRHSGFNVHSRIRAQTKKEAERVGRYMIRPLLALERLSFEEKEGQVSYRFKLTFSAAKPPPPRMISQELLMAAEAGSEYFS